MRFSFDAFFYFLLADSFSIRVGGGRSSGLFQLFHLFQSDF